MKISTLAAVSLALALCACGPGAQGKSSAEAGGKESSLMTALRAVFAFKACTGKLEEKFNLGPINGVSSSDMDPVAVGKPGEWDVKFTADVTEKLTGRVSRYKGVCHVRRDRPTTLEAAFLSEIKPSKVGGEVRRIAP